MSNRVIGQVVKNEILGEGVITKIADNEMEIFLYNSPYRDQRFIHDDVDNEMWERTHKRKVPVDKLPQNRNTEPKRDYSYRMSFYLGL